MSPADPVNLGDVWVALGTALAVAVVFLLFTLVQRKTEVRAVVQSVSAVPAVPGMDGPVDRFSLFETKLDTRMGAIEQQQRNDHERLTSTEHDVKNIRMAMDALPNKDTVHRLEVQVTSLAGKVETLEQAITGIQRSTDRIEDYLLNGSKNT